MFEVAHPVMADALDGLEPEEIPRGLAAPSRRLTARRLVRAAAVCLEHLRPTVSKAAKPEFERLAELVAAHLASAPGGYASLGELQAARIDASFARGTVKVAACVAWAASCEAQSDGRGAAKAAGEAARLTTKLLRQKRPQLKAYLKALHEELTRADVKAVPKATAADVGELAPVYERPFDDELRQVVADQLLEKGDARGQLIALQYALAGGKAPADAEAQVAALLRTHEVEWLGPLAGCLSHVTFELGFPCAGTVTDVKKQALEQATGAPQWATVRRLLLQAKASTALTDLLTHPVMRSLVDLRRLPVSQFSVVAGSGLAERLTNISLVLPHEAETAEVRSAALGVGRCSQLTRLGLEGSDALCDELDLERFSLVELTDTTIDRFFSLGERARRLHWARSFTKARVPDLLIWHADGEPKPSLWLNLGANDVPRVDLLLALRHRDWSKWHTVTVYAKQLYDGEAQALEPLTQRFANFAVTQVTAGAPVVEPLTPERQVLWLKPRHPLAAR